MAVQVGNLRCGRQISKLHIWGLMQQPQLQFLRLLQVSPKSLLALHCRAGFGSSGAARQQRYRQHQQATTRTESSLKGWNIEKSCGFSTGPRGCLECLHRKQALEVSKHEVGYRGLETLGMLQDAIEHGHIGAPSCTVLRAAYLCCPEIIDSGGCLLQQVLAFSTSQSPFLRPGQMQ